MTVAGDGNIKAFPLPEVRLPPGLHGFTPKRGRDEGGCSADRRYDMDALPIQAVPGKHRLPGLEVRWFDPDKQKERRTIVGPFEFDVVGTLAPPTTADSVRHHRRRLAVYGGRSKFSDSAHSGAWLAHPAWLVVVLMLSVMAWWPQRLGGAPTHEEAQREALELALERALRCPGRGLGREEPSLRRSKRSGLSEPLRLDRRLNTLDTQRLTAPRRADR